MKDSRVGWINEPKSKSRDHDRSAPLLCGGLVDIYLGVGRRCTELAVFLQARGTVLQLLVIYVIVSTVPLGVGVYLLLAPRRGGNFLNDAFAIFPAVEPTARIKKLFYRALGIFLIGVSTFYIHQIYSNIVSPVEHYFQPKK